MMRDYEEALRQLDFSISLNPRDVTAYRVRATVRDLLGRYSESIENDARALKIDQDGPSILIHRGNNYYALGKFDEAISNYNAAIRMKPDEYY